MKIRLFTMVLASALLLGACSPKVPSSSSEVVSNHTPSNESTPDPAPGEDIDWEKFPLVQFEAPKVGSEIATITTTKGNIKIMFYPDLAPKAVENFITHAKKGYYNNLKFHRVMAEFMIQGGDPKGTGTGGESIWGAPFEDEFSLSLWNFRGALSMANSGVNTNGSQFFIVNKTVVDDAMLNQMKNAGYGEKVIAKYKEIGGTPWLDGVHTVFGYVTEGMDVVDAIANAEADGSNKPKTDILIKFISFETVK